MLINEKSCISPELYASVTRILWYSTVFFNSLTQKIHIQTKIEGHIIQPTGIINYSVYQFGHPYMFVRVKFFFFFAFHHQISYLYPRVVLESNGRLMATLQCTWCLVLEDFVVL